MGKKELKEYAVYPPPWFDNHGSCFIDPGVGIPTSLIKDKIKIKVSFSKFCKKFSPLKINRRLTVVAGRLWGAWHGVVCGEETLSFVSQDGLVFLLFRAAAEDYTFIWQVYFDDNYKYPPNIKDSRKETTAFKKWLLAQI